MQVTAVQPQRFRLEIMIVFLDIDGTLVNSFPGISSTLRRTFDELGVSQPTDAQLATLPGPPLEVSFASWGLDPQYFDSYVKAFRRNYFDFGWKQSELFAGFADALPQWKEAGYTLCTASSKARTIALRMLERLEVLDYFDFIGGADVENNRRFGKAEVIEWVLDSMDLRHRTPEILMVGDRIHDVEGAHQYGISTALVGWGHGSPAEWEQAEFFAPDFPTLEAIITDFAGRRQS